MHNKIRYCRFEQMRNFYSVLKSGEKKASMIIIIIENENEKKRVNNFFYFLLALRARLASTNEHQFRRMMY